MLPGNSPKRLAYPFLLLYTPATSFQMFAVVSIAGFQEIVKEGDTLTVPLLEGEAKKKLTFEDVLMVSGDKGVTLGAPFVKGATVEVEVVEHGRDEKIRVVKFRRRKRFTRVKGHKQHHTMVKVTKISVA
jgi:large subunit ribosomal protein L21